jgi:hypothetical protein
LSNFLTTVSSSVDVCTSALAEAQGNNNLSCLEAIIGATVFYSGNEPQGFLGRLRAAIAAGGNFGISGLVAILAPQVTVSGTGADTGTGTDTGTDTGTGTDNGIGTNGNGNGVSGIQGPDDPSIGGGDDRVPVAATIGVTAAGLALVLFVVLLAGRRRRRPEAEKVEDGAVVRQYTDDEEDDLTYTRELEADAGAYENNIAQVVDEEEDDDFGIIPWGQDRNRDHPIYSQPIESILSDDDNMEYTGNHSCSSPSCKICAMKAEEEVVIHFIPTMNSFNAPVSLSRDSRTYTSTDTVDL